MSALLRSQYTHLLQAVDHIGKAQEWAGDSEQNLADPSARAHLLAAMRHLSDAMADADALEAARARLVQTSIKVSGANQNGRH